MLAGGAELWWVRREEHMQRPTAHRGVAMNGKQKRREGR